MEEREKQRNANLQQQQLALKRTARGLDGDGMGPVPQTPAATFISEEEGER